MDYGKIAPAVWAAAGYATARASSRAGNPVYYLCDDPEAASQFIHVCAMVARALGHKAERKEFSGPTNGRATKIVLSFRAPRHHIETLPCFSGILRGLAGAVIIDRRFAHPLALKDVCLEAAVLETFTRQPALLIESEHYLGAIPDGMGVPKPEYSYR